MRKDSTAESYTGRKGSHLRAKHESVACDASQVSSQMSMLIVVREGRANAAVPVPRPNVVHNRLCNWPTAKTVPKMTGVFQMGCARMQQPTGGTKS